MRETDKSNDSRKKLKYIVAIMFIGFISVTSSYFTVKTLVPTPPAFTSTSSYITATNIPTFLPVSQAQPSRTLNMLPSITPTQSQMPDIETNLLKNSGFESGLSGWTYLDNLAGPYVYEIPGVNGKGFCSRQYLPYVNHDDTMAGYLKEEWAGFVQEVQVVPNETYFFSGWVKPSKAINVYALARYYNGSEYLGWGMATHVGTLPDEKTTNGWYFIHGDVPIYLPGTNRVVIGLWHGVIPNAPMEVDSTICVDDLVFGKIIK
jgi:hypothetical protein